MVDQSPSTASASQGPRLSAGGARFSVLAGHATAVELCLFDGAGREMRRAMEASGDGTWSLEIPGAVAGQQYGFRAHGPWAPTAGHLYNPAKLLIDPLARAVTGPIAWHPSLRSVRADGRPDPTDSAPHLPRAVLVDEAFDWHDDVPPATPLARSVVYECHVRGMTMQHPGVEPHLRGTFLGLASPPILEHLRALGVTAVELLPVMHMATDARLQRLGLVNYWGYATAAYLAPDSRFATGHLGEQVREFKQMVRCFHQAGIEVILDIVFNHTAELGVDGPTLAWRGLDNAAFYLHDPSRPGAYVDVTGCGHTLDCVRRPGLELLTQALRYWTLDMHVDGFRFDLAPALARGGTYPDGLYDYFSQLRSLPELTHVKLIAEPWDLGWDGYQLGKFPSGWSEWNDRFRDAVRRYWRGDPGMAGALATAVAGSSDLFANDDRAPHASVNYVASHDGFTLADLVRYEHRRNAANGEGGRDGHGHNWSRNWGVEGPSDDPRIEERRGRCLRAMLATVLVSQGLPMLGHGDELGRTQRGNNNAYCHDGPLTWVDWAPSADRTRLVDFVRAGVAVRQRHAVLGRSAFLAGDNAPGAPDAEWLRPDGVRMAEADWHTGDRGGLALLLRDGVHDALVLLFNNSEDDLEFTLPAGAWQVALDSTLKGRVGTPLSGRYRALAMSLALLEPCRQDGRDPSRREEAGARDATSGRRAPPG